MLWVLFKLLERRSAPVVSRGLRRSSWGLGVLAFATVLSGGFVAGLKAGHAFNTFPLMAGQWIPPGYLALEPTWRNFFENIATVQFNHRLLAISTFALVLVDLELGDESHHGVDQRRSQLLVRRASVALVPLQAGNS